MIRESDNEKVPSLVLVSFGITRECDLKCPHCYSDSGDKDSPELTTEEAKKVIRDVADLGAKVIILDGGEPTLRGDLLELIEYSTECKLTAVIGSHGLALTKKLTRDLRAVGCKGVAISLDGARAKTHDKWRGLDGAWQKAIEGAKNCAESGLIFQFAPLVHSKNVEELPGIVECAKDMHANALEVFDFVQAGRGKGHDEYELNAEQRKRVIRDIIRQQREGDLIFRVIALPQYWVMVEKTVPDDEIMMKFVRSCCAAGIRYITILPNGDVIPCMVLQKKVGNVRNESIRTIWHESTVLKALRNRGLLKGKCGRCRYKYVCAGARCKAYEKTGDILAEDPTCWFTEEEVLEEMSNVRIKEIAVE